MTIILPHERLPPPFDAVVSFILLEDVAGADYYLALACVVLTVLMFVQLRAFARPPPVPLKRLPKRPLLTILFTPDDISTSQQRSRMRSSTPKHQQEQDDDDVKGGTVSPWKRRLQKSLSTVSVSSMTRQLFARSSDMTASLGDTERRQQRQQRGGSFIPEPPDARSAPLLSEKDHRSAPGFDLSRSFHMDDEEVDEHDAVAHHTEEEEEEEEEEETPSPAAFGLGDLPDSFAPLLSSSQMEILSQQLTADLVHAVQAEGGIRMTEGRHEIPLDQDSSRPQLLLDVPKGGCRISAVAMIGSDGFSSKQDLDVNTPTTSRSTPMVKNAGVVFDPPLPLSNVAPTLIHFPTLFEDNVVPTLRRIQFVRLFMDFVVSISSFLEKCLWIIESKCQIHLSKIRIVPLYKGRKSSSLSKSATASTSADNTNVSPDWRLSLSFSGHLLLFGWIPFPFISVTLPTFIIPQPHALLEYLLTSQPLASARLRRENIAEEQVALALLGTVETWAGNVKVVATPPAVGVDVTLPGGVAVAVELGLGRDPTSRREGVGESASREGGGGGDPTSIHRSSRRSPQHGMNDPIPQTSDHSMSSWTTHAENSSGLPFRARPSSAAGSGVAASPSFDANQLVPWSLELSAKGSVSHEKISVHILKLSAEHSGVENGVPVKSRFTTRGSLAIWKLRQNEVATGTDLSAPVPLLRKRKSAASFGHRRTDSFGKLALETEDTPSVAAVLLFPEEASSYHQNLRMLQYDYTFDVSDNTKVDAITLSVGATHPMLNGGTMVTTILDSVYAFGSVAAREDSILDPNERKRKRNILRHLPAVDFTFGIQSVFIPRESSSYSDDGQTLFIPEVEDGRMMIRFLGGIQTPEENSLGSNATPAEAVSEGIKVVADFEVPSLVLRTEGAVKEFPELDIFEGVKLRSLLSGMVIGSVRAHLRPQKLTAPLSSTGPNIFNPLEAYEIDFSRSSLSLKMKEFTASLGHRRIIFPTESTAAVNVIESIVDMGFEGKTQCELSWDFQGLSPILQVTSPGKSPAEVVPENKQQVSLLVAPLRQGRLSLNVSSVGGINITKAATSREDKEGLYDWKFFNALVSPDEESAGRILDVIHDKRTMDKLLQVVQLLNKELHKILSYVLKQVWRAKEVFDQEGVSDPGHVIPMYKMARLISLFITGEVVEVDKILPIVERVVKGDGLDIVKVKELLREHLEEYDEWAPELDRAVRWAAVLMGPMPTAQPYVEENVIPLAESPYYASKFQDIPSASQLYDTLLDKPQLPLDPLFSNLVSRVAPYLSFRQIEFFLEARSSSDWQPADLRRIRYVYSIKRKVLEIAESYGGLSFLPQSFLVSVFLGEATRTSMRASHKWRKRKRVKRQTSMSSSKRRPMSGRSTSSRPRWRRRSAGFESHLQQLTEMEEREFGITPAERVASLRDLTFGSDIPGNVILKHENGADAVEDRYELGDSLLGPQDVAILLQAGLTSVMKTSTVVQLNQRMLLDLICSQPRSFAVAVLAEIGSASQGSPRGLTSALMALLEVDQTAFKHHHQIDMHALLESWFPGVKIPRREDYLAGGRWARQSYYEAVFSVATSILEEAEVYTALKGHLQRVRHHTEIDPLPQPREKPNQDTEDDSCDSPGGSTTRLQKMIENAKELISKADEAGRLVMESLVEDEESAKEDDQYDEAIKLYNEAFNACAKILAFDKYAFHAPWFHKFYKRNYDALMIKSMLDNVIDNVDNVRHWLQALRMGAKRKELGLELLVRSAAEPIPPTGSSEVDSDSISSGSQPGFPGGRWMPILDDDLFVRPEKSGKQVLLDAILDATIYEKAERERLRKDPLVRLLIPNPPGHYNFVIVTAMGVITEGKKGLELADAFKRLEEQRGVKVIRADTGTARSFEFNASKIEEAIEVADKQGQPYGYLGYSQGCANALMAETTLLSGTPKQQQMLTKSNGGLVCRQLLFSAANGSFHGPAMEKKIQRLIVMCEEFFKYQQGYVSWALSSLVLVVLNDMLDSAHFHKVMGGAQSFLPDGCRAFWREAQHLANVPTSTLKGVMEEHTTPECLEMISHLLTKQSGSALHDSQVHVFDAVGYPVYYHNRNGRLLKQCDVGEGAIQRTHHWSPLSDEVEFVRTTKDIEMASFDCAKDRHVFPWVDVNARFGFIKYASSSSDRQSNLRKDSHPLKLLEPSHNVKLYTMTP